MYYCDPDKGTLSSALSTFRIGIVSFLCRLHSNKMIHSEGDTKSTPGAPRGTLVFMRGFPYRRQPGLRHISADIIEFREPDGSRDVWQFPGVVASSRDLVW